MSDTSAVRSQPDPALAPLFAPLDDALRGLAQKGQVRRYRKGTVVIEEGDRGDTLYVILAGRLRVYSASPNGREITYGVYGPGEYFGEMSLDCGVRCASVATIESVMCSVVTRDQVHEHISQSPEFARHLFSKLIGRARAATLSAKNLALNDVYGRLKLLLESMAQAQAGGEPVVGERLTHQDLANRLGCSREMISRVMKDLEQGGYVRIEASRIVLAAALPARW